MKPTLLVLAAGMGSRYGSLKQIDPVGPSGETIIDYSVYDAIRAGYGKVVFIIRKSFENDFNELFIKKIKPHIDVECVYQELENIPSGFSVPEGRTKPWGTAHAILMAKNAINEPFAVINGDDFYGASAFKTMADHLMSLEGNYSTRYALVGYRVGNTMSEHGSVSRGVCLADEKQLLKSVTERTNIRYSGTEIVYSDGNSDVPLDADTLVSMNFWGFTPEYFRQTEPIFKDFLSSNPGSLTSEYYIPTAVDYLINNDKATVACLTSDARWFGVTYKEDKPLVINKLSQLIQAGVYPAQLWK